MRFTETLRRRGSRLLGRLEAALGQKGIFRPPWVDFALLRQVRARHLTYLDEAALLELARSVARVETLGLPGALVEAGCALGGSAVVMARTKTRQRPLLLFDVFGQIPAPSAQDGADVQQRYRDIAKGRAKGLGGEPYYGYLADLRQQVSNTLDAFGRPPKEHNTQLVKGLFEDTMQLSEPVALAHLDCDWYASVRVCLQRIWPALVPGGELIIDDYHHWTGCRKAVDEHLATLPRRSFRRRMRSRLHLQKR